MIIMIIRINCYRVIGRCGGNSPMLTKYNSLTGCRVQPALTRYRGGLGSHGLRQQPAPTRLGARYIFRRYNRLRVIRRRYNIIRKI